ncbi:hypothetical protein QTP88_009060 [Uroleucon formosanum]
MSTAYRPLLYGLSKFLRDILLKTTDVFQETDLLLIKCNYSDGKDAKVFQERAKIFGSKKIETIIGLQIQGPHAISKCSAILANDFPQFITMISKTDTEAKELIKMFFHIFESEFQP